MVSMSDLWWQILVAGVVCFFASFILWAVLPFRNKMFSGMGEGEATTLEHIRMRNLGPGMYCFPYCSSPKDMKDPEFQKRLELGPVGMLHVWSRQRPMALCMGLTVLTMVVVSAIVAYLLSLSGIQPGAAYMQVFRFASAAAFLGYAFGGIPDAIWFGKSPKYVMMMLFDGLIYALLTAGVFAAFWPGASTPTSPV
jgi:hypothetical protein